MSTGFIVGMVFLAVFGGYVIASLLLLRFPTLIHQKKKSRFRCNHISHRGGAGENLENTMTAFRHAAALGTEMLEIDCHVTSDGQVVVSHDNDLNRSTGCDLLIHDVNYQDLPPLKQNLTLDFYNKFKVTGSEDRQIPLLRSVFEEFPTMPINIDLKINNDRLIAKVSEMIVEYGRQDLTVWGNNRSTVCDKLYKLNPEVPLLFSLRRVVVLTALFYSGLLPFVPLKESFLEILMPSIILRSTTIQFSRPIRAVLHIADFLLMSKTLFSHLERRGIQTYLWVLNEEEDYHRAFQLGAAGVMTDFPTKLTKFLDENPQYRKSIKDQFS